MVVTTDWLFPQFAWLHAVPRKWEAQRFLLETSCLA